MNRQMKADTDISKSVTALNDLYKSPEQLAPATDALRKVLSAA